MPGIKHFFPGNPGIKSIPGKFSGNSGNWKLVNAYDRAYDDFFNNLI